MYKIVISPNPVASLGFMLARPSPDGLGHVGNIYRKADADLFAEAPAMLAALRASVACLRGFHASPDFGPLDDEAIDAGLAILARIDGTPTAQPAPPTPAALGRFVMQDYRTLANLLRDLVEAQALGSIGCAYLDWVENKLLYLEAHDPEAIEGGETAEAVRRSYQGGGR